MKYNLSLVICAVVVVASCSPKTEVATGTGVTPTGDATLERFHRNCKWDQVGVENKNNKIVIVEAHETKRIELANRMFHWFCRQGTKRTDHDDTCKEGTNLVQVHRSGKGRFEFKCMKRS